MLDKKDEHGFIENIGIAKTCLDSAAALEMHDIEWQIPILVSVTEQVVGKVNVFSVHEIVFIKQA